MVELSLEQIKNKQFHIYCERIKREISKVAKENKELLNKGKTGEYQNNANYIRGLSTAMNLMRQEGSLNG